MDERGYLFDLVALQRADEVPFNVLGQDFRLCHQFLGAAFSKDPLAGTIRLFQCFHRVEFGNSDKRHIVWNGRLQLLYTLGYAHVFNLLTNCRYLFSAAFFCSAISSSPVFGAEGMLSASKGKTSINIVSAMEATV